MHLKGNRVFISCIAFCLRLRYCCPQSEDASYRKVVIPPHRMAPLKQHWLKIYTPLVEHLKLQVRFNPKAKAVEIRSHASTVEVTAVQRAAEYVKAFCCGFSCEVRMGCGVC